MVFLQARIASVQSLVPQEPNIQGTASYLPFPQRGRGKDDEGPGLLRPPPGPIRIVARHHLHYFFSLGPQIFLIYGAILVYQKGHNP